MEPWGLFYVNETTSVFFMIFRNFLFTKCHKFLSSVSWKLCMSQLQLRSCPPRANPRDLIRVESLIGGNLTQNIPALSGIWLLHLIDHCKAWFSYIANVGDISIVGECSWVKSFVNFLLKWLPTMARRSSVTYENQA